ncbi:hypothetical protein [Pseudoalteromonas phage J2-1]|uniref:Uncharacterized protein n=1 Tax=Pseudoalteromonas phage J2-1 TaxID=2023998 RepID=A0A223LIJ5_9CAUD|nr:hypothetical protein HOR90_gp19 [Pseudoalteromonas phage J2-1]ASU03306.1 hypothetical protein [Pseudoalteromonas phage J2-1]
MRILMVLMGWLGLISGNLFWIGHAIYELVKTDQGFFTIVATNFGWWLLHMAVSILLFGIGFWFFDPSKKKW